MRRGSCEVPNFERAGSGKEHSRTKLALTHQSILLSERLLLGALSVYRPSCRKLDRRRACICQVMGSTWVIFQRGDLHPKNRGGFEAHEHTVGRQETIHEASTLDIRSVSSADVFWTGSPSIRQFGLHHMLAPNTNNSVANPYSHSNLGYRTRSPTGASRAVLKKLKHSDRIIVGFAKFFSTAGRNISMSPQQMSMVAHEHGQCRQKSRMFRSSHQTINRVCQAVAHVTLRVQALQMCKLHQEFERRPPDWAVAELLWDETGDEQLPMPLTSLTDFDKRPRMFNTWRCPFRCIHRNSVFMRPPERKLSVFSPRAAQSMLRSSGSERDQWEYVSRFDTLIRWHTAVLCKEACGNPQSGFQRKEIYLHFGVSSDQCIQPRCISQMVALVI